MVNNLKVPFGNGYVHPPQRLTINISEPMSEFCASCGITTSSHTAQEITRQIFHVMDNELPGFTRIVQSTLPDLSLLSLEKHILDDFQNFRLKVHGYAYTTYFFLFREGLFINNKFPYLLENISHDVCLLYFDGRDSI